jgi:hypothetical protein
MRSAATCLLLLAAVTTQLGCPDMFRDVRDTPPEGQPPNLPMESQEQSFGCHGETPPPSTFQLPSGMSGPTGKLQITCQADAPSAVSAPSAVPAPPMPGDGLLELAPAKPAGVIGSLRALQRTCRFALQNASLSEVGAALAEATGSGVAITPSVGAFRVSIVLPEATVGTFLTQLESARWGIATRVDANLIRIGLVSELGEPAAAKGPIAMKTRVFPVRSSVSAREVAGAACEVLSRVGRVRVVNHSVVVFDSDEGVGRVEKLLQSLDGAAPGGAPDSLSVPLSQAVENAAKARALLRQAAGIEDSDLRRNKLEQADRLLGKIAQSQREAPTPPPETRGLEE